MIIIKYKLIVCIFIIIFLGLLCLLFYKNNSDIDILNNNTAQKDYTNEPEITTTDADINDLNQNQGLDIDEISDYIKEIAPKYNISDYSSSNYVPDEQELQKIERNKEDGIIDPEDVLQGQRMGFDIMKETAEHFNVSVEELLQFISENGK